MSNSSAFNPNPLMRFTIGLLPTRMKRMVFLASLTAIAKESNVPEAALIQKLNEVLELSSSGDGALKFPIAVSQLIWANKSVFKGDIEQLTQCQGTEDAAFESAEKIAKTIPEWFRYDNLPAMVKDIVALFSAKNCIFPAHVPVHA